MSVKRQGCQSVHLGEQYLLPHVRRNKSSTARGLKMISSAWQNPEDGGLSLVAHVLSVNLHLLSLSFATKWAKLIHNHLCLIVDHRPTPLIHLLYNE